MAAHFGMIDGGLAAFLALVAFSAVRRRPSHTRRQLLIGAALGGGVAGALTATLSTAGGASLTNAWPFAALGLLDGALIGLLALAAFRSRTD